MVVELDAEAGVDALDTGAGVDDLATELATMIVFVVVEAGVLVVDGVLAAGVFCTITYDEDEMEQKCRKKPQDTQNVATK